MKKRKSGKPALRDADQVFRQFAWNLAGRLKAEKPGTKAPARKPARQGEVARG